MKPDPAASEAGPSSKDESTLPDAPIEAGTTHQERIIARSSKNLSNVMEV